METTLDEPGFASYLVDHLVEFRLLDKKERTSPFENPVGPHTHAHPHAHTHTWTQVQEFSF